jgi:HEAT repeat protein
LTDREAGITTEAAARLEELSPTLGELTVLLTDRNPFVRSGAAWWLRNLQGEVPALVVDALRSAICDPNAHVVQAALGTAGVLRLAAARDDARAALDDSNAGVVHSAIFAIGRIGPAQEGAHLLRFLHSKEQHLELATITALTNLRFAPAISSILSRLDACRGALRRQRAHFELPRRCMLALVNMDARSAIPLLIEIARDEIGLRGMAVQALIDLKAEQAAPALLPVLQRLHATTHEEKLCCTLIYLMTAVNYRFAMPQVREFLQHRLTGVRCAAIRAVARWDDRDAIASVRQMALEDPSAFVRPVAVTALGDLVGCEAAREMQPLLSDANALVRQAAVEVLGKQPPSPLVREQLASLVDDPVGAISRIARQTLTRLQQIEEPPLPEVPVPEGPSVLPCELRIQASAARGFLERWQAGVEEPKGDLAQALNMLLQALKE